MTLDDFLPDWSGGLGDMKPSLQDMLRCLAPECQADHVHVTLVYEMGRIHGTRTNLHIHPVEKQGDSFSTLIK